MADHASSPRKRDSRVVSPYLPDIDFPATQATGSPMFGGGTERSNQFVYPHFLSDANPVEFSGTPPQPFLWGAQGSPGRISTSPSKQTLRKSRSKPNMQPRSRTQTAPTGAVQPGESHLRPAQKRSRTNLKAEAMENQPGTIPPVPRHRTSTSIDSGVSRQGQGWPAQHYARSQEAKESTANVVAAAATRMIVNLSQAASSQGSSAEAAAVGVTVADAIAATSSSEHDGVEGFPSRSVFHLTHSSHLAAISLRRDKTLTTFVMYDAALWYLLNQANLCDMANQIADSSQGERNREAFRRWCVKSFRLVSRDDPVPWNSLSSMTPDTKGMLFDNMTKGLYAIVTADTGKGIMPPSCVYELLVKCHDQARHGGRDKTHSCLKHHFANVSKELVQAFIKICPTCSTRRRKNEDAAEEDAPELADQSQPDSNEDSYYGTENISVLSNSLPQIVSHPAPPPAAIDPHNLTQDQIMILAALRAQGYDLVRSGGGAAQFPTVLAPPIASTQMERRSSAMSDASASASSATTSTDGPTTPQLDPSDSAAFSYMDSHNGAMHNAPRLTPTTSGASTVGGINAKTLNLPLDANPNNLRRFLQAMEAGCTVQPAEQHPDMGETGVIDPALLWGMHEESSGKKQRAARPPPLNLTLHPDHSIPSYPASSNGPTTSDSMMGGSMPSSATSVDTTISEPALHHRVDFSMGGFLSAPYLHAPTSAPALQTEFNRRELDHSHQATYMEKRNVNSPRASPSSHKSVAVCNLPRSQLPSFGPTYGAVFGNASLGGRGNLFDDQPIVHSTPYGAPDVRLYLDATYGLPEANDSSSQDGQGGRARTSTISESVQTALAAPVRPDPLRRHSHSGQHSPIEPREPGSSVPSSESGAEGDDELDAASTGSVIVHDLSSSEDGDADSEGLGSVNDVSAATPGRTQASAPHGHGVPQTQPSPLDRTVKKANAADALLRYNPDSSPSSPSSAKAPKISVQQQKHYLASHGPSPDFPIASFRKMSLAPSPSTDSSSTSDPMDAFASHKCPTAQIIISAPSYDPSLAPSGMAAVDSLMFHVDSNHAATGSVPAAFDDFDPFASFDECYEAFVVES